MSYTIADLEELARKIRYDATAIQGKVSELLTGIAEMAARLPEEGEKPVCPVCGLAVTSSGFSDHIRNVHGMDSDFVERMAAHTAASVRRD